MTFGLWGMRHLVAFLLTVAALFLLSYLDDPASFLSSGGDLVGSILWTLLGIPLLCLGIAVPYVLADLARYVMNWPRWSPLLSVAPLYLALVVFLFVLDPPQEANSLSLSILMIISISLLYWSYSLVYGIPLVAMSYLRRRPEQEAGRDPAMRNSTA